MLTTAFMVSAKATKQTFLYAEKSGEKLYLDHYAAPREGLRPCVIFLFGGAFARGDRAHEDYAPYFDMLTSAGYDVVSIDYRLGLKNPPKAEGLRQTIGLMKQAVRYAVEDLYSATRYVLDHAKEWNIDPSKIVVSGSSAGAIAALQAEHGICNSDESAAILGDFNYAGLISFAGAIFSTDGRPKWAKEPCPQMLFHGTSDRNVPYRKVSLFGIGFYGSKYITRQLNKLDSPYWFYSAEYVDHSLAGTPLYEQLDLIMQFIQDYVIEGKCLRIVTEVESIDGERRPTNFSVKDYLRANYGK
jgi:predicted esterase